MNRHHFAVPWSVITWAGCASPDRDRQDVVAYENGSGRFDKGHTAQVCMWMHVWLLKDAYGYVHVCACACMRSAYVRVLSRRGVCAAGIDWCNTHGICRQPTDAPTCALERAHTYVRLDGCRAVVSYSFLHKKMGKFTRLRRAWSCEL